MIRGRRLRRRNRRLLERLIRGLTNAELKRVRARALIDGYPLGPLDAELRRRGLLR